MGLFTSGSRAWNETSVRKYKASCSAKTVKILSKVNAFPSTARMVQLTNLWSKFNTG